MLLCLSLKTYKPQNRLVFPPVTAKYDNLSCVHTLATRCIPCADRRHFFLLKIQRGFFFCRDCICNSVSNLIGCLISLKIIKCLLTCKSEQYNNSIQWSNMICSPVKIKTHDFFFRKKKYKINYSIMH